MPNRILRTAFLASAITLGLPAVASATPNKPATLEASAKPLPARADQSAAASYAEREANEKQAAEFEGGLIESTGGGTVVVISGAALVAFLLLAIIIM